MKITCIQMNMAFARPEENFRRASELIADAARGQPDVIVLPETWNTGFFPHDGLASLCDRDCAEVKRQIGALAAEFRVNIVAGSVANQRGDGIYNTAAIFDRQGTCIAQYDKTHLFSPMQEDRYFRRGDHLCEFTLDGRRCGVLICYDIRFPELTRTMTVGKRLDYLFLVSQWPAVRIPHLETLTRARAIENQMFTVCCNSCGSAGETRYGGASVIYDPWGETLAKAGDAEQCITADCDESVLDDIRSSINVFADRREELYCVRT